MDGEEVQENLEQVMKLLPREDDNSWIPEQARAEDAAAAVAYALRCRENGQSTDSAWAARRAYEAVDHFCHRQNGYRHKQARSQRNSTFIFACSG